MFSDALEEERAHPEYVEISIEIISFCQNNGQQWKER